jgi:hypothetical protein
MHDGEHDPLPPKEDGKMMTTDLATTVQGMDFTRQADLLRALQEEVRTAPLPRAEEVVEQAHMIRDWLKLVKGSALLAVEATRLECIALRRIDQAGATDRLPVASRGPARRFGAMNETEFEALLGSVVNWVTPLTLHLRMKRDEDAREDHDRGRKAGRGQADSIQPIELAEFIQAAGALLGDYSLKGQPFTIAEVADEIARDYGDKYASGAFREGLREAVRQALRVDDGGWHDEFKSDGPAWVTYFEDRAGWVRIPWGSASLDQFAAMVELRVHQLETLRAVVGRLAELHARLKYTADANPAVTTCRELEYKSLGLESAAYQADLNARMENIMRGAA